MPSASPNDLTNNKAISTLLESDEESSTLPVIPLAASKHLVARLNAALLPSLTMWFPLDAPSARRPVFLPALVVLAALASLLLGWDMSNNNTIKGALSTPRASSAGEGEISILHQSSRRNWSSSFGSNQSTTDEVKSTTSETTATVRVPKQSPNHVYQCGFLTSPKLGKAIFPEVNVTPLSYRDPVSEGIVFRGDDVMITSCFGPCPLPHRKITGMFPGTILFVNNHPRASDCDHLLLRSSRSESHSEDAANDDEGFRIHNTTDPPEPVGDGKPSVRAVVSLSRMNSPPILWNESTFGIGTLMEMTLPRTRKVFFAREKRPTNTMEHFLIYAQSHCTRHRDAAFRRLSKIGPVHYVGKCNGGGDGYGERVQEVVEDRRGYSSNNILFRKYRFALTMENTAITGYISEKIMIPFAAGTIPVYYGTREIFDVINPKAFIWYDIHNPREALDRIRYLERNRTAYVEMLHEPILANGEETIAKYFSLRDEAGGGRLKWAVRDRIGFG